MDDHSYVAQITNEAEAWELLEKALASKLPPDFVPHIQFRGWPQVEVYLPETPIESSITPTMMQAFIELQESIYRSHTLLTSDTADLRALTQQEREQLELRVKVSSGSNQYVADAAPIIERIGTEIVSKMTPEALTVTLLGTALLITGSYCWKKWLASRVEVRKAELEQQGKDAHVALLTQHLDALKDQREHDTKRLTLLQAAISKQPVLSDIEAVTDSAKQQMVRVIGEEAGGTVQGVRVEPAISAEITATRRQSGIDAMWQAVFRVDRVDTTTPEGFRVVLTDVSTGESITASLQDALLSVEHRQVIEQAVWKKMPVRIRVTGRRIGKRVTDAVIRDAEPVTVGLGVVS